MSATIKEDKLQQILEWWEQLKLYPLEWDELKSCKDHFQVAQTFGFKMLRNRLIAPYKHFDVHITTLCVLLCHIVNDNSDKDLITQFSQALEICTPEQKIIILEIPFLVDRKDLLKPFTFAITALEGQVNMIHLIHILHLWDENIRKNFEEHFYKK